MTSALVFRRKPRVRSFLEYTVRQTLDQQHTKLKEYSIAVEVFNRPEDFDPRLDSIVRVEARRLRATVDRYYETDGREDEILIRYRRGNYVPSFDKRGEESEYLDPANASFIAGGALMIGVLAGDDSRSLSEMTGQQATASLTILRAPYERETLEFLRSGDRRIVLLKPATMKEVSTLLDGKQSTPAPVEAAVTGEG